MSDVLQGRYAIPWGYLDVGTNEISIVSTVKDPPKVRLGADAGGSLGCFSFNRGTHEVVLLQGKIDERYRSVADEGTSPRPTELVGELRVDLLRPRRPGDTDDSQMVPVLTLRHDGVTCHVPGLVAQAEPRVGAMWSEDGLFVTQQQSDGNFVSYELARPFDRGRFRALWSSWGGKVTNPMWQGV